MITYSFRLIADLTKNC